MISDAMLEWILTTTPHFWERNLGDHYDRAESRDLARELLAARRELERLRAWNPVSAERRGDPGD